MWETNRRPFGHGCDDVHSGSYWIINTLEGTYVLSKKFLRKSRKKSIYCGRIYM
ncbi:hypothetical protein HMPREF0083_01454 [Aneurinibacillus aneurinilyticus ATCC 12856]|uniref:Uncharacterized protein n=1 Tax=Aneurinibacillus aneurinilyticus ATCC 12856 TaxID=649747 RepID=U1X7M5_ANEAE|nr:hypothetical protein HMPREF0083_01454 [Aneurinibacillus aneurinilyticus ATCC 12856]